MDKIKVNNQVVKMRKHVKRAKLFAINKYTKNLKQLQNKKGIGSQAEKNQRKVERLLEKVKILKKMMPDFVSKKALTKAENWSSLLAQKNIPLEAQCLALLANDGEIQKEVDKFYAEECQLVEKIPNLFLEWEVKSKMPKTPDKKKTASDIKKQKLNKITNRKKSNFKSATFPNNVAVDKKSDVPNQQSRRTTKNSNVEGVAGNQNEIPESMEEDVNENIQFNSESDNNSSDDESEDANDAESEERIVFKKQENNNNSPYVQSPGESPSKTSSSEDEGSQDSNMDSKTESNEDSATGPKLSIFERLNAIAKTGGKNQKAKNSKLKLASQKTKAIKVLNLSELEGSEQIHIQNSSDDTQELATPVTNKPKKDSFFLNGDEEVESSDDDDDTNNFKKLQPKKFSNFDRYERNGKFKKNNFGDKPGKSFSSFKERDFGENKNRFQNNKGRDFNCNDDRFQKNRKGKDFNRNEDRFQRNNKGKDFNRNEDRFQRNNKGKDFNRNDDRFQKNRKGNFQFNNNKKFDNRSKDKSSQFKQFNSEKKNDSFNHRRENKNVKTGSFQYKKESYEKSEKNVNLHPSWEAKNKIKEAAKSGFQGKRFVFD